MKMKRNKIMVKKLILFSVMMLIASTGFAEQFSQLNNSMNLVVSTVLGGTGMAIATLAVAGFGIAFALGKAEFTTVMIVVGGIALLFASPGIVSIIKGAVGGGGGFF